jgi:prolyl-tRNA editing enzyme YbaK/EbsC (Cys-tRNA(Pro) deacylase)
MPIYVEKSILELPKIYINGGHRGFCVEMDPADLVRVLHPEPVEVGLKD